VQPSYTNGPRPADLQRLLCDLDAERRLLREDWEAVKD